MDPALAPGTRVPSRRKVLKRGLDCGLGIGFVWGAICGTAVLPGQGTLGGAIAGAVIGLVASAFITLALTFVDQNDPLQAQRQTLVISIALPVVATVVASVLALIDHDKAFVLLWVFPGILNAAWGGLQVQRVMLKPDQREQLAGGPHKEVVPLWAALAGTLLGSGLLWIFYN